jgi:hypothetical protein
MQKFAYCVLIIRRVTPSPDWLHQNLIERCGGLLALHRSPTAGVVSGPELTAEMPEPRWWKDGRGEDGILEGSISLRSVSGLCHDSETKVESLRIYCLGFQQWANSFREWLIPMTLNERFCFE